jgi:hypothetical protein
VAQRGRFQAPAANESAQRLDRDAPGSPGNFLWRVNRDFFVIRVAHTTPPKSLAEFGIHPAGAERFAKVAARERAYRQSANLALAATANALADPGD